MASDIQLFDQKGHRLYLTPDERLQFIVAAQALEGPERTFCETIAQTGCRISEAIFLTSDRIDYEARSVVFRSLKKRGKIHYRAVPVPDEYLQTLKATHRLSRALGNRKRPKPKRLWNWGRTKAWQLIKDTMSDAGIPGAHATPKGLRHAYAVAALERDVPLTLIQKWLGHASLNTTAIYLQVVGKQEREFAERMWE